MTRRGRSAPRATRVLGVVVVVAVVLAVGLALSVVGGHTGDAQSSGNVPKASPTSTTDPVAMTPLQARIVSIAQGQVGYSTDPSDTYCNRYSAYWVSGNDDCGNSNLDEEWCADFAAWVWKKAGANVDYQYINGDLNSSAASFYEWGMQNGTWHPVGEGYTPQPGDVAVYGLDVPDLVAQHVAVVTSYTPGDRGPNVVNGDGDHRGFSVVETGQDEVVADIADNSGARLSGYVSPVSS
jgi:hypothetical protein